MGKAQAKGWYMVLLACRQAGVGGITAAWLAGAMRLPPAHAAAWLGKLARWGYLCRVGAVRPAKVADAEDMGGRPSVVYRLTAYGRRRGAPKFTLPPHPSPGRQRGGANRKQ